jgi:tetratricopeptide (TPR) repeat protein
LAILEQLARRSPRRYAAPADRLVLGAYFLRRGGDARQILELFYDPIVSRIPEFIDVHLASAQLALDKYDNGLAVKTLEAAPDQAKLDPRYHYLLARAFMEDDAQRAAESLDAALEINPRHVDSLLLTVERLIDGEKYDEAKRVLADVERTNPVHPIAWAFQAVLANLRGDFDGERAAREAALESWSVNPAVDHTIGRKLSDKYRFAEGASYQRRALAMDESYLPAQMQLAQDLLRLGHEEEGWELIHRVFERDGYNVVAHNLVMLHDSFDKYVVVANDSFRVRMEAREAAIYGERVLALLDRAKKTLCAKYGVTLDEPVIVEIFPQQKDFAVRTFGIPGADGFLGVCFGNVITANSPAALGASPANWEAVLWHELCHVVTLHKSQNKMPRWLSEGISVYEELEQNPNWGQRMSPSYRQMIVEMEFAPLSELSSAFLAPQSAQHLQFAYFESALAVEFLANNYGIEAIHQILDDLADGSSINETLIRHVAPLGKLDAEFTKHLRDLAEKMAPGLSFEEVDLPPTADLTTISAWLKDHPDNFEGLVRLAQGYLQEEDWQKALVPAQRLRELFPHYIEAGNSYSLLARTHRGLGDTAAEREVLEAWAEQDSSAVDAYIRLMELGEDAQDWEAVQRNARRMLAVDPLTPLPHRYLARAAEKLDLPAEAIAAYRALLQFETSDPVGAHFQLATLLFAEGQTDKARREVLMALEDAPRFLDAHRLLLELEQPPADPAGRK